VIVTFLSTFLGLVLGVPAGYGIAKARSYKLAALILLARMTPALLG